MKLSFFKKTIENKFVWESQSVDCEYLMGWLVEMNDLSRLEQRVNTFKFITWQNRLKDLKRGSWNIDSDMLWLCRLDFEEFFDDAVMVSDAVLPISNSCKSDKSRYERSEEKFREDIAY